MANLHSKKEVRIFPASQLKIEKRSNGKSKISGYSAVFNRWSEDLGGFRERIKPGAFKNALARSDVRALFNHDSNFILGRESAGTLKLHEDSNGLYMDLEPPDTQFAHDLLVSIERGDIKDQSFGFIVAKDGDKWENLHDESKTTIRTIEKIDELFDVSIVTFPAYPDTSVALRSRDAAKNRYFMSDFELFDEFDNILPTNRKSSASTNELFDRVDRAIRKARWYTDPKLWKATKSHIRYHSYNALYRKRNSNSHVLDRVDQILNRANKYKINVPATNFRFSRSTQRVFERMDRMRKRMKECGNPHLM
jgi:HK97 family phage prohead protease